MWPFSPKRAADPPATGPGRLDQVESDLRMLKAEWLDTLDRLERMVGRIVKRGERDAALLSGPSPEARGNAAPPAAAAPASRAMADVLKRRGVR